jgi:hypothetical protein
VFLIRRRSAAIVTGAVFVVLGVKNTGAFAITVRGDPGPAAETRDIAFVFEANPRACEMPAQSTGHS